MRVPMFASLVANSIKAWVLLPFFNRVSGQQQPLHIHYRVGWGNTTRGGEGQVLRGILEIVSNAADNGTCDFCIRGNASRLREAPASAPRLINISQGVCIGIQVSIEISY